MTWVSCYHQTERVQLSPRPHPVTRSCGIGENFANSDCSLRNLKTIVFCCQRLRFAPSLSGKWLDIFAMSFLLFSHWLLLFVEKVSGAKSQSQTRLTRHPSNIWKMWVSWKPDVVNAWSDIDKTLVVLLQASNLSMMRSGPWAFHPKQSQGWKTSLRHSEKMRKILDTKSVQMISFKDCWPAVPGPSQTKISSIAGATVHRKSIPRQVEAIRSNLHDWSEPSSRKLKKNGLKLAFFLLMKKTWFSRWILFILSFHSCFGQVGSYGSAWRNALWCLPSQAKTPSRSLGSEG